MSSSHRQQIESRYVCDPYQFAPNFGVAMIQVIFLVATNEKSSYQHYRRHHRR